MDAPSYGGMGGGGWNPQQPTFYLDGVKIDAALAQWVLHSGSASVDPAKSDPWALARAGIFGYWERGKDLDPNDPRLPEDRDSGRIRINSGSTPSYFVVTGIGIGSSFEFWHGIKGTNVAKVLKSDSYKAVPTLLKCLGYTNVRQTDVEPVENGHPPVIEFGAALFGQPNDALVERRSGNLNKGATIVCHSNGCANLVEAIRNAGQSGVNINRIIAVAPNIGKLNDYKTLNDAVKNKEGLVIIKSDRDGALRAAPFGSVPNNVITGNILYNGLGKEPLLSGATLLATSNGGFFFPASRRQHGVDYYQAALGSQGYCVTK